MLEMLRAMGLRVIEVDEDDIPDVCLYVTAADLFLIRRGACAQDVARLAEWALLREEPQPHYRMS